jgi:2'-5' RNA ligase
MAFFVIAYPKIAPADFGWLQSIRQKYDSQYQAIHPHFTFVFGTEKELSPLLTHVETISQEFNAFRFVMRCVMPVKDSFSSQTHLFLVPDEGFSQVVRLHDQLYSGLLAPDLRLDIPFIPHLTIANFSGLSECKQVCDEINQTPFTLEGSIESLDVIESQAKSVRTLAKFFLRKGAFWQI